MQRTKHKKEKAQARLSILIAVGLVLLLAIGGVVAKYIWNNGGRNLFSSKEFYFTSNLLEVKTEKYVLNSTVTAVTFTLGNNADKLRYSEDAIKYSVTLECKSGENKAVLSKSSGTLAGNKVSSEEITLSGLENITISSTVSSRARVNATFFPIIPVDPIILTCTIVNY